MIQNDRLIEWLARLVRVPSVNPAYAGPRSGPPGEGALAAQVADWFAACGGEVAVHEVLPGRPNVYGIWRGQADRWAGVDVHIDTVGVEQMAGAPFSGHVADGRLYGRGAADTKATLGVALALLEAMHQSGRRPQPNLLIAATVDEEAGATGAPAFARWLRERPLLLDELVVAEPTLCAPICAHKGVLRFTLTAQGRSAHSSRPEQGENAVMAAARLALAMEEEHRRLQTRPGVAGLSSPTLTITRMEGGRGLGTVPDACTVWIDRRIQPDERAADVQAALVELARESCPLPITVEPIYGIDAFAQSPDAPWVRQMARWTGHEPTVVPYCTNAWAYPDVARACLVLGPGSIAQAHGEEEWVAVSELERLAAIFEQWWDMR